MSFTNDIEAGDPDTEESDDAPDIFWRKIKAFLAEMVEVNPVEMLLPETERNKMMKETYVRSRQYITLCMVIEIARMIYLNTS
jgi:hypothetical protein